MMYIGRLFQQVTEFYSRDPSIPADDDIAELTFLLNEEKIFIKHHLQVNFLGVHRLIYRK